MKIEGVDDAAEFRDVLTAMNTLQFSSSTVESMLKAIAGILLLGTLSDAATVCCCGIQGVYSRAVRTVSAHNSS
jgi:hypothetical protein